MKKILFFGSSLDDLRAFPDVARHRAGYQLFLIQNGIDPTDWKPVPDVGSGCREIRVREESGAFRVFFVATIGELVFVLHCFQKKSQRTSKADLDVGRRRYREMTEYAKEQAK